MPLSLSVTVFTPFPMVPDWALLDCYLSKDLIFEPIFSPPERYQNIQDNPEYNSTLPSRIILKIFVVNMLYNIHSDKK